MIYYRQKREPDPNAFPPERDEDLGIYKDPIDTHPYRDGIRVYVDDEKWVKPVMEIIKRLDEFEFDNYCLDDLVAVYQIGSRQIETVPPSRFYCDWRKLLEMTQFSGINCFIVVEPNKEDGSAAMGREQELRANNMYNIYRKQLKEKNNV